MKLIKTIRCETVAELIIALGQLGSNADAAVDGSTPIRQGYGDGCVIALHRDEHDTCISIEEFDYGQPRTDHGDCVRFPCAWCHRAVTIQKDMLAREDVIATCPHCKKINIYDREPAAQGEGYRVGDEHTFNPSEHDTHD